MPRSRTNCAHPLTILRGRLQGAKDGVFPLDDALVVGLMKQVEGLTRLVEDLRSVSLAESGRLELVIGDVDLAAELEDMRPILSSMLSPAGFELEMTLEDGVVRADAARIRQAVVASSTMRVAMRRLVLCGSRLNSRGVRRSSPLRTRGQGCHLSWREALFANSYAAQRTPVIGTGPFRRSGYRRAHGGDAIYQRANDRSLFVFSCRRRKVDRD